jgi:hypothetical protein
MKMLRKMAAAGGVRFFAQSNKLPHPFLTGQIQIVICVERLFFTRFFSSAGGMLICARHGRQSVTNE